MAVFGTFKNIKLITLPSTVLFAELPVKAGMTQALVQEVRDSAE